MLHYSALMLLSWWGILLKLWLAEGERSASVRRESLLRGEKGEDEIAAYFTLLLKLIYYLSPPKLQGRRFVVWEQVWREERWIKKAQSHSHKLRYVSSGGGWLSRVKMRQRRRRGTVKVRWGKVRLNGRLLAYALRFWQKTSQSRTNLIRMKSVKDAMS